MTDRIQSFRHNLIAFHRPIKRTYFILQWRPEAGKWCRYTENLENLALHRSNVTQRGTASISIALRPNYNATSYDVISYGYYLKNATVTIPIVKKTSGGTIPANFSLKDYTQVDNPPLTQTDDSLWTVRQPTPAAAAQQQQPLAAQQPPASPASPAAAAASQQPRPASITLTQKLKAIPQRIAWLIAEEASKREEVCPISMENLSPITSTVTTCFHVFETTSITQWLATSNKCPVCRDYCKATVAFTEEAPPPLEFPSSEPCLEAVPPASVNPSENMVQ